MLTCLFRFVNMSNKVKYNNGNVKEDAEIALAAEMKVIDILNMAFPNTKFESVHDDKELWHTGDIKMSGNGFEKYIDVKDDGAIHYTHNVFAENYKYYHNKPNVKVNGFMKTSKYDLLGVLDDVEKKLYILDFVGLKKIYKNYELKKSKLRDCNSYGNCVPLKACEEKGILLFKIKFEDNDNDVKILDVKKYLK